MNAGQVMPFILAVESISQSIATIQPGDWVFFDIDDTLLLSAIRRYEGIPELSESELPSQIKNLIDRGIKVCGLTTRSVLYTTQTLQQLLDLGIILSDLIHASTPEAPDTETLKGHALRQYVDSSLEKPKRILVIDDSKEALEAIETSFSTSELPLLLYCYLRTEYQTLTHPVDFPINLRDFTKIEPLGSGGTASVFRITNEISGQVLVLKLGAHPDARKVEILCNAMYQAMGVPVPRFQVYNTLPVILAEKLHLPSAYGIFQISEYLTDAALPKPLLIAETKKHFIAHVLLGNIDVVKEDNFVGKTLVDAGANFLFRALGSSREDYAGFAQEIESLRDGSVNPESSSWFAELEEHDMMAQVIDILGKQDILEKTLWEVSKQLKLPNAVRIDFLQFFVDRLDDIVMRICPEARRGARIDRKANEQTAAGVLSCAKIDGEMHVLLGRRRGHDWWDNLGGKSELTDITLAVTASREVAEESSGQLQYTEEELLDCSFHDLITKKNNKPFIYRMYIAGCDEPDLHLLTDEEHTDYQWVSVESILKAIQDNHLVTIDDLQTLVVAVNDQFINLYPPLSLMFRQKWVLENIYKLGAGKKPSLTHTQSAPRHTIAGTHETMRTLQSPDAIRHQINATLIGHSAVLREMKALKREVEDDKDTRPTPPLSQSELHLKVLLGADYIPGDVRANVALAVKTKVPAAVPVEQEDMLIDDLTRLIKTEKEHPDFVYFYHACSRKVAFAYQLYTMIHQILQASDAGNAFRCSNEFFQSFEDIAQLIAHYSHNGTRIIDNNEKDFHEVALSTNVFLFGNHRVPSSNSIVYLLQDSTTRDLNLHILLSSLLGPLGISKTIITKLLTLYEKYSDSNAGALYQMGMPREKVKGMTYPAATQGSLNPYQDHFDLDEIITTLQTKVSEDAYTEEDASYILSLQSRIMVPPHELLKTSVVRLEAENTNDKKLLKIAQNIVLSLLKTYSTLPLNTLHKKTPLLQIQSGVYEKNLVDRTLKKTPAEDLAHAIINHRSELILEILKTNPRLKNIRIFFPEIRKYVFFSSVMPADTFTYPLEKMIIDSSFSNAFLAECFGESWIDQGLQLGVNFQQIIQRFPSFTQSDRPAFFKSIGADELRKNINDDELYQIIEAPTLENITSLIALCKKEDITQPLILKNTIAALLTDTTNTRGNTVFYEASVNNPELFELLIHFIPQDDLSIAIKKINKGIPLKKAIQIREELYEHPDCGGETLLDRAVFTGDGETIRKVLNALKDSDVSAAILPEKFEIQQACSILDKAIHYYHGDPNILNTLLQFMSVIDKKRFLYERLIPLNRDDISVERPSKMLKLIEYAFDSAEYGRGVFDCLYDALAPIKNLLSEELLDFTCDIPGMLNTMYFESSLDNICRALRELVVDEEKRLPHLLAQGWDGNIILRTLIDRFTNEELMSLFALIPSEQRVLAVKQALAVNTPSSSDDLSFFSDNSTSRKRYEELISMMDESALKKANITPGFGV
jgi:8-oxo-dGTP pyrophosphatase MutT (NUDIX family)